MAQYTDTYGFGATNIIIGTGISLVTQIIPQRAVNGGFFKINTGGGTLAIVNGFGSSYNSGYPVGSTEVVQFSGPAKFFLAASGATMTVSLVQSFSDGFSLLP